MSLQLPFIITISRQMGSGGSEIGRGLSEHFEISYVDREIIRLASKELRIKEEVLEKRDEKRGWLDSFLKVGITKSPMDFLHDEPHPPSEYDLIEVEANIIRRIAKDYSAIIVGRCGGHTLRDYSRNLSIFLHADEEFRWKRMAEMYKLPENKARKMVEDNDKARARYHKDVTGMEWNDARQYHLAIDTGRLGLESAKNVIISYASEHFVNK
ncbi:MAG: cytidylate kinase-like family protein [Clostridiales bacterium]|nr:cytidylate kinase-like family protein [Clostridiales bacterium]